MPHRILAVVVGTMLTASVAGPACAQLPGDGKKLQADVEAVAARVDEIIARRMQEAGVKAAAAAEPAAFYRRLHLDLGGKIPDPVDVQDFVDDDSPDKRWTWAEKIINSPAFTDHFANVLRAQMIPTSNNFQVLGLLPPFEVWLKQRLQANASYDAMVRELLTNQPFAAQRFVAQPNGMVAGSTQAFYFANENKAENLAGATARLFLGVKLECAQCHAHPFAKWTREQFWEFAAFFNGVNPQQFGQQPKQPVPVNRRQILIPGTKTVVKAKYLTGQEPAWKDSDDSRTVLASWITSSENPYFAKATVDMVWQYFFGVSLLDPILEPHDDNPITHPELLEVLAQEFIARKFDLKFLVRIVAQTRAYQRSSAGGGKSLPEELLLFARMPVRGLSPEQIFDSVAQATEYRQPPFVANQQRFVFPGQPTTPRADFLARFTSQDNRNETQTSILQALFMMNGKFLAQRTRIDPSMTTEKLASLSDSQRQEINISLHTIAMQSTSVTQKIESLYRLVLSRPPRPDESQRLVRYVESGGPARDSRQAIADVYWALLNSGEFLLNH